MLYTMFKRHFIASQMFRFKTEKQKKILGIFPKWSSKLLKINVTFKVQLKFLSFYAFKCNIYKKNIIQK